MNSLQLKVLMVGNSFSRSVVNFIPDIIKARGYDKLRLRSAYIGGCSFARHMDEYNASINDPSYMPYKTNIHPGGRGKYSKRHDWDATLPEMLASDSWDIVTIQQASHESWRQETFEDAEPLIAVIRKTLPTAKIVVHQTWSYRNDNPNFKKNGGTWDVDQEEMFKRAKYNYCQLAYRHNYPIIPVGDAVQIARAKFDYPFKPFTPEQMQNLRWPDLPPQYGDVVGRDYWQRDPETGNMCLGRDTIHLNPRGEYLQACVWYMKLFKRHADDILFFPEDMDKACCQLLIQAAEEAVYTN